MCKLPQDIILISCSQLQIREPYRQTPKPQPSITEDIPPEIKGEESVNTAECVTEELIPPIEGEVKDENVEETAPDTVPLTQILIEFKPEEIDVKEETAVPEANRTEEPVSPIEVKEEEIVQENGVEEPLPPPDVKEEMDGVQYASNPFARLQQSAVRAWTVRDLFCYITSFCQRYRLHISRKLSHENIILG